MLEACLKDNKVRTKQCLASEQPCTIKQATSPLVKASEAALVRHFGGPGVDLQHVVGGGALSSKIP